MTQTVDAGADFTALTDSYNTWRNAYLTDRSWYDWTPIGVVDYALKRDRIAALDKDVEDAQAKAAAGDVAGARVLILAALSQTGVTIVGGGQNTSAQNNVANAPTLGDATVDAVNDYGDAARRLASDIERRAGTVFKYAVVGGTVVTALAVGVIVWRLRK